MTEKLLVQYKTSNQDARFSTDILQLDHRNEKNKKNNKKGEGRKANIEIKP